MDADAYMGRVLVAVGVAGLSVSALVAGGPPPWAWLALVAGGLGFSVAWRAAGVRRVSEKERRQHARRLKNAEIRERRLLRKVDRNSRRMKEVLSEVREHPGMDWAHSVAQAVRELQAAHKRHEAALVHGKMLADKTAADLTSLVDGRLTDTEE